MIRDRRYHLNVRVHFAARDGLSSRAQFRIAHERVVAARRVERRVRQMSAISSVNHLEAVVPRLRERCDAERAELARLRDGAAAASRAASAAAAPSSACSRARRSSDPRERAEADLELYVLQVRCRNLEQSIKEAVHQLQVSERELRAKERALVQARARLQAIERA